MSIGEQIKEIMKKEKVNQSELAKKLGMSRQSLSQIINRNPESIKFNILSAILDKLGYEIQIVKKPE